MVKRSAVTAAAAAIVFLFPKSAQAFCGVCVFGLGTLAAYKGGGNGVLPLGGYLAALLFEILLDMNRLSEKLPSFSKVTAGLLSFALISFAGTLYFYLMGIIATYTAPDQSIFLEKAVRFRSARAWAPRPFTFPSSCTAF